ncbi:MAG: chromosome segregation protein SMC [Methanotrichaceae archaeon]
MYIKEVELKNFKSFGKRIEVPLKDDFMTITGPNGSGKSNIVDALLFALCLSSSRAMRAERLPDLIYRGDNGHNPDFAQVTVRLDNTSRTMPIEQDVIEISRKIKVNNDKCASSYYFNGKACSQGELQDKLAKAGITPEGYNVVMQGDVTHIIQMAPVERRKIVDEIAGVAEFDEKKKKALEELDVVRERIGRIDIILEEVGAQAAKLKDERDRALRYQASRDELRRQEAFLLLAKLKESSDHLLRVDKELDGLKAKVTALQQTSESKRAMLGELDSKLNGLNSEIDHKGEDEQIQVKRRIEELKGGIAREVSRREMAERSAAEAEEQQKASFIQIGNLQQEILDLSKRIMDANLREASLRGELNDQMLEFSDAKEKIAQADAKYSELRDTLEKERSQREDAKAELGDLIREQDRLLDSLRRSTIEREDIEKSIAEISSTLSSSDREIEQLKIDLASLNNNALDLEKDRDNLDGARLRIRRDIAEADRELQRLQSEYARIDARIRASEDRSGYSHAVESIRSAIKKQMLSGLYGIIAELGDVNPRYSAALEVAAGARLQSIVANSDEDAAHAIDYLKRSQIGRATFLPLNKLEAGSLPPRPERPGVIGYALSLVDFNPKFLSAFWYVFRDTLVVETLSHARQLMGKYRMVTLDGDLIEKSGAMTGGHYKSRVRFAAEEGNKLVEFSAKISSAEGKRSSLLDRQESIEEDIAKINREIEELDKAISKKTFRLDDLIATKPSLEKSLKEKMDRLAQLENESQSFRERLGAIENDIQTINKSLEELQAKIDQIESKLAGSEIPELSAQADAASSEIKRLEARLKEIEASILKDKIREEANAEKLKDLQARRESLDAQIAEALERKRIALESMASIEAELKAASDREVEIESEIQGLKGDRKGILDQIIALQREIDQAERERDRAESRLATAEAAASETRSSVENLRSEIEARGVDSNQEPPSSDSVAQKIRDLTLEMTNLEPVNMLAIEEYDHVEKRNSILQDRRNTLHRERETIIDKLDRYDQMKKESFLLAFNEINKNFKSIFRELSKGEGELILENPDDPLTAGMTIKARPAGKPFHRLEAMSGGEKSLTALSFIFAIQMFRPAPFYAMDEIDMFLDGVNVERVAKLIKRISAEAQFIVVSLRKPMIQQSKYTLGVTMQENNISNVTGICTS